MAVLKNGAVTIEGIDELEKKLKSLRTTDPTFEKRLRGAIREILKEARNELSKNATSGLDMKSDPRQAYRAVRFSVYKRIFGGQVNILQSRKAGAGRLYEPKRKGLPKRGGNRQPRSKRTEQLMSYQGKDRGFILRFLNQGTGDRAITNWGGRELKTGGVSIWKKKQLGGNRGSITARHWFGGASQKELERSAERLQKLIDKILKDEFK
jgi:hypothetical protein